LSIVTTFATGPARGGAAPADGKPVRVTHVHVGNLVAALRDELQRGAHEFLEALVHLAPPEPHGDAVGQIEFPGAARSEAPRRAASLSLRARRRPARRAGSARSPRPSRSVDRTPTTRRLRARQRPPPCRA